MLLYLMSWVSLLLCVVIALFCFAVGLFYMAELVEEYTVLSGKIIRYTIFAELGLHLCLLLFEGLPWYMVGAGLLVHLIYFSLLSTFPAFVFTSFGFLGSLAGVVGLHFLAFQYFGSVWYPFEEVIAYFTLCIWLVPFMFLISLSANELVLPQTMSQPSSSSSHNGSSNPFSFSSDSNVDFVSAYLKGKRRGLLYFLSSLKDRLLPERFKKSY